MDTLNDLISQIQKAPISLLVIVALNLVGIALYKVPQFPNGLVGLTLVLLGGIAMYFCGDCSAVSPTVRFPYATLIVIGTIYGAIAWLLHDTLLKRFFPEAVQPAIKPEVKL